MSAFAGILRLDGAPAKPDDLAAMAAPLASHGPDARGLWLEGAVALTHHLMRMTPEDANERQPRVTEDAVLVLNGRLDHREELERALGEPKDLPDSDLLLAAWRRWGQDCLQHIEGDFAFVLWDRRARRLFAAVDALGARGLYYHHQHPFLLFATVPTALLAHPACPRDLDDATLAGYLGIRRAYAGETFFRGIQCLAAGQALTLDGAGLRLTRHWDMPQPDSLRLPRDEDYPEALLELLERSVASRLRSAHPVGVSLSGGLDSSSVAWVAARQLAARGETLASYTSVPPPDFVGVVPDGRYADETDLVRAQAMQLPNLVTNFVWDRDSPLDHLGRWFESGGTPIHGWSNRTWMETMLGQAGAAGHRVLLTGQVGNSSFSFNGMAMMPDLARRGRWLTLWREAAAMAAVRGVSLWRPLLGLGLQPLLPRTLRQQLRRLAGKPNPGRNSALHPAALSLLARFPDGSTRQGQGQRRVGILSQTESYEASLQAITGVELRDPTRDRRLVAFCLALPADQFLKDGVTRRLARRAMAGKLPPAVLNNKGKGMQGADWYQRLGALRPRLPEVLARYRADPLAARLIHLDMLDRLLQRWPDSGWGEKYAIKHYHGALGRGLMAGEFILWFHQRHGLERP